MENSQFTCVYTSEPITIPGLITDLYLRENKRSFEFVHDELLKKQKSFTPSNKIVPNTKKRIKVFNRVCHDKGSDSGMGMISFIKDQNGLFPNLPGLLIAYRVIREKVFRPAFQDTYNLKYGISLMAPDVYSSGRRWVPSMYFNYKRKPRLAMQDWISVLLLPSHNCYFFFLCD